MHLRLPIAAITDEFSPSLDRALPGMREIGMRAAELRVIDGKNVLDLNPEELRRVKGALDAAEMAVVAIASPLLKCVLEKGPELDRRFQHDAFASKHTQADQEQLAERAIQTAKFFGAPIIRVFSFWRTVDPPRCSDAVCRALEHLASIAGPESLVIGLENEHACNVATGAETAEILRRVPHPALGVVWDPANAFVAGEMPWPQGYKLLPKDRIVHVHAKDCDMLTGQPAWGPLGTRHIPWKEQIAALLADGFRGCLSLETHWGGPAGDKFEASRICGWNLRGLAGE